MKNILTTTLLAAVAAAVSQAAPIPVNACGTNLNVAGATYVLTQNLSCPGIAVNITADNVVFDLQGFTITRQGTAQGAAIITALGPSCVATAGVQVRGGTISNYSTGVAICVPGSLPQKTHAQITKMKFLNNANGVALFNAVGNDVSDNVIDGTAATAGMVWPAGIYLGNSTDNTLYNNRITNNARNGILLANQSSNNIVKGNQAGLNKVDGVAVDASSQGNILVSNITRSNGQFDLSDASNACGTNTWKANVFVTANQPCIQ